MKYDNKERWKWLNVDQKIATLERVIVEDMSSSLGVLAQMLENMKQMKLKNLLDTLPDLEKSFMIRLSVLSKQASEASDYIRDRDRYSDKLPAIDIPFTPIKIVGNDILVLGSRPPTPRTLFAIQVLEENSIRGDLKGLAYFIGTSKKKIIANSGRGKMFHESPFINLQFETFGIGDQFILKLKREVREYNPDYILINGLEKIFPKYCTREQLVDDVNLLLADLRKLSDERNLPIIITTHILFGADLRGYRFEPMLAYFGSDTLEIIADQILTLSSPFAAAGYEITAEDEDLSNAMQLYMLKPFSQARIPIEFMIDREKNIFYPKEPKE